MDVETLKPGQCINDAIIKFWMNWLKTPRSPHDAVADVHVFSTYFVSGIMNHGYNPSMQRWLKRVNIFDKKLLILPIHAGHHWSLVAVFNPKLIMQTKKRMSTPNYTGDVSCMVHLDSLGSTTIHDRISIGNSVRLVLNKEWDRHYNNGTDRTNMPFNHRSFKLHCPKGKLNSSVMYVFDDQL
jgi:Ulp1 family protease